jgi:hypothetical protein
MALTAAIVFGACADVPRGWSTTLKRPYQDISVTASSEQGDRWPASKAIDGDTSEPEGIWQTLRDNPETAWLELQLVEPRTVKGVRIFHQKNAGYYRSIDYTIACWADGAWATVTTVEGNKETEWREHLFDPMRTGKMRITITKSEHGFRMGLNEVELVLEPEAPTGQPRERLTEPISCGTVAELGQIAYSLTSPPGTSVDIRTRTAPDVNGAPGAWSDWSAPYTAGPSRITSPNGAWIQCRAVFHDTDGARAEVQGLTLGWPHCVERIELDELVPRPGEPVELAVHFREKMDRDSSVQAELTLAGQETRALADGAWDEPGLEWRFEPLAFNEEGLGELVIGGACTANGSLMHGESTAIAVGEKPLLDRLVAIGEWMMENPHDAIFIEGYNERTLLGLFEITGEQRYLDHVRTWAQWLLKYQKPEGYWPTGYGDVYFADTGSALGLLINFYKFATDEEKKGIDLALQRYADLLLVRGDSQGRPFVHEDGSLGVGYKADKDGNVEADLNKQYTISTALTGAEIFGAMYYMTGNEQYKQIAMKACDWLLDTMVESGQIPYYIDDWNPDGKDEYWVWERWPYDTSAYAGEGFLAAWIYVDDPEFRERLGRRVKPHIEWVLRTQNDDGSWARKGSGDQLRSHGIINMLLWYNEHISADPRVVSAVQRWYLLVLDEEKSAYLRVPGDGIATSLTGRALLEIVRPGVDCYRWKD